MSEPLEGAEAFQPRPTNLPPTPRLPTTPGLPTEADLGADSAAPHGLGAFPDRDEAGEEDDLYLAVADGPYPHIEDNEIVTAVGDVEEIEDVTALDDIEDDDAAVEPVDDAAAFREVDADLDPADDLDDEFAVSAE